MRLGIKEKSNYEGLVEAENRRDRRQLIKVMSLIMVIGIGIIIVAIFGAFALSILLNKLSSITEGIHLGIEHVLYIGLALVIILGSMIIFEQAKEKRANDKFLKTLYRYLPLDKEDINNNGLVNYMDYLLCINKLIKEIDAGAIELNIHERVRHDIIDVMKSVYLINDKLVHVIEDNFETLVFKCDTKEKIRKLINYYIQKEDLSVTYESMQKELGI